MSSSSTSTTPPPVPPSEQELVRIYRAGFDGKPVRVLLTSFRKSRPPLQKGHNAMIYDFRSPRFGFLVKAVPRDIRAPSGGYPLVTVWTPVKIAKGDHEHFASQARECRVVWTDVRGYTWMHEVIGITSSTEGDGSRLVFRLGARRATHPGFRDHKDPVDLGGMTFLCPPKERLRIVSSGSLTVMTDLFPIQPNSHF